MWQVYFCVLFLAVIQRCPSVPLSAAGMSLRGPSLVSCLILLWRKKVRDVGGGGGRGSREGGKGGRRKVREGGEEGKRREKRMEEEGERRRVREESGRRGEREKKERRKEKG